MAEFIGETNMVDLSLDGLGTAQAPGGVVLQVQRGAPAGKATAVIRPADLTITEGHAEGAIAGTVRQEIYLGSELHYLIDTALSDAPWRVTARDDGRGFAPGKPVSMRYDPADLHLIREGAA